MGSRGAAMRRSHGPRVLLIRACWLSGGRLCRFYIEILKFTTLPMMDVHACMRMLFGIHIVSIS